jgi:hypothetical protein
MAEEFFLVIGAALGERGELFPGYGFHDTRGNNVFVEGYTIGLPVKRGVYHVMIIRLGHDSSWVSVVSVYTAFATGSRMIQYTMEDFYDKQEF